jgi:hypothetical protein
VTVLPAKSVKVVSGLKSEVPDGSTIMLMMQL